jgi:hypothetical protein
VQPGDLLGRHIGLEQGVRRRVIAGNAVHGRVVDGDWPERVIEEAVGVIGEQRNEQAIEHGRLVDVLLHARVQFNPGRDE